MHYVDGHEEAMSLDDSLCLSLVLSIIRHITLQRLLLLSLCMLATRWPSGWVLLWTAQMWVPQAAAIPDDSLGTKYTKQLPRHGCRWKSTGSSQSQWPPPTDMTDVGVTGPEPALKSLSLGRSKSTGGV